MGTLETPREFLHLATGFWMLPLTFPQAPRAGATVTPRQQDRPARASRRGPRAPQKPCHGARKDARGRETTGPSPAGSSLACEARGPPCGPGRSPPPHKREADPAARVPRTPPRTSPAPAQPGHPRLRHRKRPEGLCHRGKRSRGQRPEKQNGPGSRGEAHASPRRPLPPGLGPAGQPEPPRLHRDHRRRSRKGRGSPRQEHSPPRLAGRYAASCQHSPQPAQRPLGCYLRAPP